MEINLNGIIAKISISTRKMGEKYSCTYNKDNDLWESEFGYIKFNLYGIEEEENLWSINYELVSNMKEDELVFVEISIDDKDRKDIFHLIPANIHGDNNIEHAQEGEFPILTNKHSSDSSFCDSWQFRPKRASPPVSMICTDDHVIGISVNPYTSTDGGFIRNGLSVSLPASIGASLGYENYPVTFNNKRNFYDSTKMTLKKGSIKGKIYLAKGQGRLGAHKIIRNIYKDIRKTADFKKTYKEASKAILDAFINVNWSDKFKEYSNCHCEIPSNPNLRPWRPLVEIGWTGGGVLGYPFALCEHLMDIGKDYYGDRKNSEEIFDDIASAYNEKSGFLNDVIRPWNMDMWPDSNVNGWWCYFGMVKDKHGAYTNGSALFYILKTYRLYKYFKNKEKKNWLSVSLKVLDNLIDLQRQDGSYGFSYSAQKRQVLDWDGFAGCWFTGAMAYAYLETKDSKYLESAKKALRYYHTFVKDLYCWGTPMDTWKSVDEEGNLGFIRGARLIHQITGEKEFLDMLEDGAQYEYLWKYAYMAKPEFPPFKDSSFNSCGGSVTSVSNPHIHPMGSMIVSDLFYLYKETSDKYHLKRMEDTLNWSMHILELYPDITGYGPYGVLSERFCPSDGLVEKTYADGSLGSTWFTFNGWAGANVMEGILEAILIKEDLLEDRIL